MFCNLPRYCPEIADLMKREEKYEHLIERSSQFLSQCAQIMLDIVQPIFDTLYLARIYWHPGVSQDIPVISPELEESIQIDHRRAYGAFIDFQIEWARHQEHLEEHRLEMIENAIHPERVWLMNQPDSEDEDPAPAIPEPDIVHTSISYPIWEVQEVIRDIIAAEDEEERAMMEDLDSDSDDSERQGRQMQGRRWYMRGRPVRERGNRSG